MTFIVRRESVTFLDVIGILHLHLKFILVNIPQPTCTFIFIILQKITKRMLGVAIFYINNLPYYCLLHNGWNPYSQGNRLNWWDTSADAFRLGHRQNFDTTMITRPIYCTFHYQNLSVSTQPNLFTWPNNQIEKFNYIYITL